jgi:hypothetical protein
VGLAQLVRFLVMELTHLDSNLRFDMSLHLRLIILSVGADVPVDSETLLATDFINLKINLTQSFGGAHRGRIYVHIFIEMNNYTCISIYVYTMFLKKIITE